MSLASVHTKHVSRVCSAGSPMSTLGLTGNVHLLWIVARELAQEHRRHGKRSRPSSYHELGVVHIAETSTACVYVSL
jgi:hypothetical protein